MSEMGNVFKNDPMPGDEPVVVISMDKWLSLVANWRVISAVTDGDDEGTLESAAVIDRIINSVDVPLKNGRVK